MIEVDDAGCWFASNGRRFDGRAALFLDRDGVVVEDVDYLRRVEDIRLAPGAVDTIAACNRADVPVVLVTNQSGVARGYFDWAMFERLQAEIASRLAEGSAHWDAAFACAHHPTGFGALAVADHPWRKPNPGMLLAAAERLGVDLTRSVIVGDRASDLRAGKAAGLAVGVHVGTPYGLAAERRAALELGDGAFEVRLAADLGSAIELLDRLRSAA